MLSIPAIIVSYQNTTQKQFLKFRHEKIKEAYENLQFNPALLKFKYCIQLMFLRLRRKIA